MARWDSSVLHYLSKLQSKVRPARQINTAARGGLHKDLRQLAWCWSGVSRAAAHETGNWAGDKLSRGNFREQVWTQPVWYPVWVIVHVCVCVPIDKPPRVYFNHPSCWFQSCMSSARHPFAVSACVASSAGGRALPRLTGCQRRRSPCE